MSEPQHSQGEHAEAAEARPEPVFNLAPVVLWLIVACAGIHFVRAVLLTPDQDILVIRYFAFIPLLYSGGYALDLFAWISPLSYSLLHGGLAHLFVNMIWLAAFGSPLAHRIGTGRFLGFWAFTALAAVALHYMLHAAEPVPLVGASGAISGMMGAAARFGFRIDRAGGKPAFAGRILPVPAVFRSRTAVTFLAVWMIVNLVVGLAANAPGAEGAIAWEAHIGGFLAGFFGIFLFDARPPPHAERPRERDTGTGEP